MNCVRSWTDSWLRPPGSSDFFRAAHDLDYQLMGGVELTCYDIPNQYAGQIPRDTGVRTCPLRGIGDIANKFVAEAFLDEVALKRNIDPMQFRLELLKNMPRGQKVLQRVAEMADWSRKRDNTALGCAFIVYNDTLISGVAEVSVDHSTGQIKVQNFWCVVDCAASRCNPTTSLRNSRAASFMASVWL